jgi:signal transduction histidine kinase
MLGTAWLQMVHEDDRMRATSAFRSASALRSRVEVDLRMKAKDQFRWWSFNGAPCYGATREVIAFIGVATDTTGARQTQRRLRDVGAKLVAAQEAERGRIARELHDDLAQRVALLIAKTAAAAASQPFSAKEVRPALVETHDLLNELATTIHRLAHQLHAPKLERLGLGAIVHALCREIAAGFSADIRFSHSTARADIPEDAALCIFRVAQEALQNSVKHSGATRIDVRIDADSAHVRLRILDDGRGFDPNAAQHTGLGLLTMQERVDLLGGRLRVQSKPAQGTTIEAVVPLLSSGS